MSDFLFSDHGSVVAIVPLTPAAVSWIDDNVVSEPFGRGMAAPSASIPAMPAISKTRSLRPA